MQSLLPTNLSNFLNVDRFHTQLDIRNTFDRHSTNVTILHRNSMCHSENMCEVP